MTATTLAIKDGTGQNKILAVEDNGALGLSPYHLEDASQRATMLSTLASNAKLEEVRAQLSSGIPVTGPLTSSQLTSAGLATAAGINGVITAINNSTTATQPVSAVSLPLPSGAATVSAQVTGNTSLSSIDGRLAGTLSVTGPLTAAQLTSAALATSALQTVGNASLTGILNALTSPPVYASLPAVTTISDATGVKIDFTTTNATNIVQGVANTKVRAYRLRLYVNGATNVDIVDGDPNAGGTILETIQFAGAGGIILDFDARPYWTTSTSAGLFIRSTSAVRCTGRLLYTQVA
jgi:hypothetical protein